ncbi:unnamed protein product [Orchesella dallaii]|uniref:C2H2-type domain-containing protein n=1 Tax=Orchesella dallaii TaxID=48710 RepID=A0ABP1SB01_9HEXA
MKYCVTPDILWQICFSEFEVVEVKYINAELSLDDLNDKPGCPEDGELDDEDGGVPSVPVLEDGYSFPNTQNADVTMQNNGLVSPPKQNLDSSLFSDSDKSPQSSKDSARDSDYMPRTSAKRRKWTTSKTASELQTSRNSIRQRHYTHKCSQCPYSAPTILQLITHLKLHEEGSGACVCPDCGWYVRQNKLNVHRGTRHKSSKNITYQKSNPGLNLKIRKKPTITIKPSEGHRRHPADKHYKCHECPFSSSSRVHLKSHLEVHREGVQGVTCSDCGWYVDVKKLYLHRRRRHQSLQPVRPSENHPFPLENNNAKISSTGQSSMQSVTAESQPGPSVRQEDSSMGNGRVMVSVSTHLNALRYNWWIYKKNLQGQ